MIYVFINLLIYYTLFYDFFQIENYQIFDKFL